MPYAKTWALSSLCLLLAGACGDARSPADGGSADGGTSDGGTSDASSCPAPSRVCEGVCAACPSPVHVRTFGCSATECVAATCDEGFAVCDTGCCEADVGIITLGMNLRSPSIALDSTGRPHVSFLSDSYSLTYARLGTGWEVRSIRIPGENAYSTAIAVDASDRPLVAYSANYALGLARYGEPDWTHESVYRSSQGYGPSLYQQGLVVDSTGAPHIASGQEYAGSTTFGSRIMHFTWDGTAWDQTNIVEYYDNRVSMPALAVADDVLQVTWVTYYDGVLRYATRASGSWVAEQASANGNCCSASFLAVAADGTPRIAFEGQDNALALAQTTASGWTERPLTDDLGSTATLREVGSIATDSTDALHYAYTNDQDQLVYVAPGSGTGLATVVSEGVTEFMLVLDAADRAHIVYVTAEGLYYRRY